jgi:chromosome partitioning protein
LHAVLQAILLVIFAERGLIRVAARIIAFANQKGGVGKTTTAANLAAVFAERYRVLAIDCDSQGNLTDALGVNPDALDVTLYDLLEGTKTVPDIITAPIASLPDLALLPANLDLAALDHRLAGSVGRELRLQRAIAPYLDQLDYVLIDCPPTLGILTLNGLAAATEVVVPVDIGVWSLKGINKLLATIAEVRTVNPDLTTVRAVLNRVEHTNLAGDVRAELGRAFGDQLLTTQIRKSVRVGEAQASRSPLPLHRPQDPVAADYRALAEEIEEGSHAKHA